MPFSGFNGDPEICLSVNRTELTIKYRKVVMKKLSSLSRNLGLKKR